VPTRTHPLRQAQGPKLVRRARDRVRSDTASRRVSPTRGPHRVRGRGSTRAGASFGGDVGRDRRGSRHLLCRRLPTPRNGRGHRPWRVARSPVRDRCRPGGGLPVGGQPERGTGCARPRGPHRFRAGRGPG